MTAATHASSVLYSAENKAQRHEPVSRAMAAREAMQGKYSKMNTMNESAESGVHSTAPVCGSGCTSFAPRFDSGSAEPSE